VTSPEPPDDQDAPGTEPCAPPEPRRPAPAVEASALQVRGPDGPVFGPIDLTIPAGGLHVLAGPSGSGRTTALLTLAGRFKPQRGTVRVLGSADHRAIRRLVAVAGAAGVDEPDAAVRVRDLVRERLAWSVPWYRRTPRVDGERCARLLAPAFGPLDPPPGSAYVQDLTDLDRMLLRVALALMDGPRMLVVDDLEQVRALDEQVALTHRLAAIAGDAEGGAAGVTVIAAAINPLPVPAPEHARYALRTGAPLRPDEPLPDPPSAAAADTPEETP